MFLLRLFDAIPPEEREKAAKAMRSDLGGDLDEFWQLRRGNLTWSHA